MLLYCCFTLLLRLSSDQGVSSKSGFAEGGWFGLMPADWHVVLGLGVGSSVTRVESWSN